MERTTTLAEALSRTDWDAFKNSQNEKWNVTDLINEFGHDSAWLKSDCTVVDEDSIIDYAGDELTGIRWSDK